MHPAVCSTCGQACEVPFRPVGNRPMYCSACFHKQGGQQASGFRERKFDRPRFEDRRKPEFRGDTVGGGNRGMEQVVVQLEQMNSKLDRILRALPLFPASKPIETLEEEVTFEEMKDAGASAQKKAPKKAKTKKKKS